MPKLSAVDAISPAFQNCKRLLFQPGRRRFWWRFGVLGLLTGELSSGGSFNFNLPSGGTHHADTFSTPLAPAALAPTPDFAKLGAFVFAAVAVMILLWLAFMFVSSIARFTLFENIIGRDVSFGQGWHRNFSRGVAYFGWMLLFTIVLFATLAIVVGGPLLGSYVSGGMTKGNMSGGAIAAIVWAVCSGLVLICGSFALWVLLKDFVVPMMQLEDESFEGGCSRLLNLIRQEKTAFAGYIGMKIVLRMGAMFALGITVIAVLIAFAVPIGLVVYWFYSATKAGVILWNLTSITLAVSASIVLAAVIIYLVGVLGSPITAFFPSYALYFFAGRYPLLEQILYPPPPPPQEPSPTVPPPEPSSI